VGHVRPTSWKRVFFPEHDIKAGKRLQAGRQFSKRNDGLAVSTTLFLSELSERLATLNGNK